MRKEKSLNADAEEIPKEACRLSSPELVDDASSDMLNLFTDFGPLIKRLFGCEATALLACNQEDRAPIMFIGSRGISIKFQDDLIHKLRSALHDLTGRKLSETDSPVTREFIGKPAESSKSPCAMIVEPISIEGGLYGLLGLAFAEPHELSESSYDQLKQQIRVIARAVQQLNSVRRQSWCDSLTGVFNRAGMEHEMYRCWMDSRRHELPICLLLADLDLFKNINDTMGHRAGDLVLKEFVQLIKTLIRASDIIARYGGDEVMIILPRSDIHAGLVVAERIRKRVAEHLFCPELDGGIRITVSLGVAAGRPQKETDKIDDLTASADSNLFEAKRQGRNRVWLNHSGSEKSEKNERAAINAAADESRINGTVLIVDDDAAVRQMMNRMLQGHGWRVVCCGNSEEAVSKVRDADPAPDVMIVDINMPGKNGFELIDEVRLLNENIVNIVVTGDSSMENTLTALRRGAYDFLGKPLYPSALTNAVERAMEVHTLRLENMRYKNHLEEMVAAKSRALRYSLRQVEEAHSFTLEALSRLLDLKEQSSGTHSVSVREVTVKLAAFMGFPEADILEISRGALLHDIGKVAIPDKILLKPGPLDWKEREIMQTHSEVGYRMLAGCSYLQGAAEIVYQHQEKYDGTGYPQGLKGRDICSGARLFAVVDAYDAMRSYRVYRQALTREEACRRLRQGAGTQFDPGVVEVFLRNINELESVGKWDERPREEFSVTSAMDILRHASILSQKQ